MSPEIRPKSFGTFEKRAPGADLTHAGIFPHLRVWSESTGYQAPSILTKRRYLDPHWGRDFLVLNDYISLVQRSCLIKEPNVNDQGSISYLNDQEYLVVIMFELVTASGAKPMIILMNVTLFYTDFSGSFPV